MNIEWKDIKGFEGYQVSSHGEIRNKEGKILSPYQNKKGYLKIGLFKDGKLHKKRVNRLVAESFINNPYNLPMVLYKSGDKHDNSVINLEWGSEKSFSKTVRD